MQNHLNGRISVDISLLGAQRFAILPFAKSTRAQVSGDWTAPSFDGAGPFPRHPRPGRAGFTAAWTMPFVARSLSGDADATTLSLAALGQRDFGVTFTRPSTTPTRRSAAA